VVVREGRVSGSGYAMIVLSLRYMEHERNSHLSLQGLVEVGKGRSSPVSFHLIFIHFTLQ